MSRQKGTADGRASTSAPQTAAAFIAVQASGDVVQAYAALRHAADHMAMIATPLADAIAKQFPGKYAI